MIYPATVLSTVMTGVGTMPKPMNNYRNDVNGGDSASPNVVSVRGKSHVHNSGGSNSKIDSDLKKMVVINAEQAKFYDSISNEDDNQEQTGYAKHKKANLLTRAWASLRYRQQDAFTRSGLEVKKEAFHRRWIEAKAGGNFLELGCFRGTRSSWPLIEAAGRYIGIDLSANAIAVLNKKIEKAGLGGKSKGIAGDFLLMEEDCQYDLIFAHGVLHHFENPKPLFDKIERLLKDDGILLLTEPSQVNVLYKTVRAAYRPFQSDSAWEWPFTQNTIAAMESKLQPIDGFGWGRYSLLISVLNGLPVVSSVTRPIYLRLLQKEIDAGWHRKVWSNSTVTAAYRKSPSA
jgi:SAM-dependent methyltransferase